MRKVIALLIFTLVLGAILYVSARPHFYFFRQVREDQIGIKIRGGNIVQVVGPGIYSDVGLFVRLETYSTQEYEFQSSDPEVLTSDNQRIGVTVASSVFRPDFTDQEKVKRLWVQYKNIYTNDSALQMRMEDLAFQAMKVCVGDKKFSEAVVGSDRDALRACIDEQLNRLTLPYGLTVRNVVVPQVQLSPEVQAKLDAITQSRLDTEKAQQDEAKAIAEGKARQAEEEARIRVEQAKRQEQTRQETTLAQLEQEKLAAQQAVIEQQKSNDLLSAERDLEIATARAAAAAEQAKADLAQQLALAGLYSTYPEYLQLQLAIANANAIKPTDKLIFTPEGVFPSLVFGNNTLLPVVPFGPPSPGETGLNGGTGTESGSTTETTP